MKSSLKVGTLLASMLALAGAANADVALDEKALKNITFSGYITGTAARSSGDIDGGGSFASETLEVDSYKLGTAFAFKETSAFLSVHSFANSDPVLLDAYASYDLGSGSSVTFGKFLSYLGYEAFDYPNMLQISYANALSAFIPAYHSGIRYDFAGEGFSGGFALLDSVYGPSYYEGDRDLGNGAGFEGYLKFTNGGFTLFSAVAHNADNLAGDQTTYDVWAQYAFGKTTLAAEYCTSDLDGVGDGHFWLLLAMQSFDKWSVTGRLSGGEDDTVAPGAKFARYTVSPAFVLSDNLSFLCEYSFTKYKNTRALDNESYLAGQFVFKF